jgi:DNA-binding LacI/PurR family transcriptional regulator
MTAVTKEGTLSPSVEITRGQMAFFYYRLDMYTAGRRTQALLSQAETDIGNVLQMLDQKNLKEAEYASARAVIAARGALASKPNEPIVKGAMKISEGFQSLVKAYKAGVQGDLDGAIANSKDAYNSAEKAKSFSPTLSTIATQMQAIGKSMADEARKLKTQPAAPAK